MWSAGIQVVTLQFWWHFRLCQPSWLQLGNLLLKPKLLEWSCRCTGASPTQGSQISRVNNSIVSVWSSAHSAFPLDSHPDRLPSLVRPRAGYSTGIASTGLFFLFLQVRTGDSVLSSEAVLLPCPKLNPRFQVGSWVCSTWLDRFRIIRISGVSDPTWYFRFGLNFWDLIVSPLALARLVYAPDMFLYVFCSPSAGVCAASDQGGLVSSLADTSTSIVTGAQLSLSAHS